MKFMIRKVAAIALALAFVVGLQASILQFSFQQNGSGHDQIVGDLSTDNPNGYTSAYDITYPATAISMTFFNAGLDVAMYECYIDASAAKGSYWVGYFPGGADVYADID